MCNNISDYQYTICILEKVSIFFVYIALTMKMMTAMDTNVLGRMYLDGIRGLELSLPKVLNFALNK